MKPFHILLVAVLLFAGLVVAVLMHDEPAVTTPAADPAVPPASPHPQTAAPADQPSASNVGDAVVKNIGDLKHIAAKDPGNAKVRFDLARLLQDGHNPAEAARYYAEGLVLDPRNNDARIDYSLCLFEQGKVQEALDQNRRVLKREGTNAKALYNVGAIHANTGHTDSAEFYWKRLVQLHPDDEIAHQAAGHLKVLRDGMAERPAM